MYHSQNFFRAVRFICVRFVLALQSKYVILRATALVRRHLFNIRTSYSTFTSTVQTLQLGPSLAHLSSFSKHSGPV